MALIDRVKERSQAELSDSEIQALIDEASDEIERRYGPLSVQVTERLRGSTSRLFPRRPVDEAEAISVDETLGTDVTTLAADDFRVWHGGRMIERMNDGTNPRSVWGHPVEITYTPIADSRQREEVTVKLVLLSIEYEGVKSGSLDGYNSSHLDYTAERERLLGSLNPTKILMA